MALIKFQIVPRLRSLHWTRLAFWMMIFKTKCFYFALTENRSQQMNFCFDCETKQFCINEGLRCRWLLSINTLTANLCFIGFGICWEIKSAHRSISRAHQYFKGLTADEEWWRQKVSAELILRKGKFVFPTPPTWTHTVTLEVSSTTSSGSQRSTKKWGR